LRYLWLEEINTPPPIPKAFHRGLHLENSGVVATTPSLVRNVTKNTLVRGELKKEKVKKHLFLK